MVVKTLQVGILGLPYLDLGDLLEAFEIPPDS
jgi:hypothetical protein